MNPRFVGWIVESLRFSAVVLVYWGLQLLPIELNFPAGKIIESVAEALIAAFLVAMVTDLTFGCPSVEIEWRIDDATPVMSGRPVLTANKQTLNVQLLVTGSSILHRILMLRAKSGHCQVHVDFDPPSSVIVQVQTVGQHSQAIASPGGAGFIVQKLHLRKGINAVADVSIRRRGSSTVSNPLDIHLRRSWGNVDSRCPRLFTVDQRVEGFHLRGRP